MRPTEQIITAKRDDIRPISRITVSRFDTFRSRGIATAVRFASAFSNFGKIALMIYQARHHNCHNSPYNKRLGRRLRRGEDVVRRNNRIYRWPAPPPPPPRCAITFWRHRTGSETRLPSPPIVLFPSLMPFLIFHRYFGDRIA